MQAFNDDMLKVPYVKEITDATQVPPGIFAIGALTLSVLLVAFNFSIGTFVVQIVGVIYPVCKSVQALITEDTIDDDKQWLTYWMAFSLFSLFDTSFSFILTAIPFYSLIKLLVLIWL